MKHLFSLLLGIYLFQVSAQNNQDKPLCLSADEDRQAMMSQLGIETLRPGRNANPEAPNAANYDEELASPFTSLPDLFTTAKGKKVKNASDWYGLKLPEIAQAFEDEVYGHIPENIPNVQWEVAFVETEYIGWTPVTAKKVIGHLDNSAYPFIDVNISMIVVTPANAQGPVPMLMMFGNDQLPAPRQPVPDDFQALNEALKKLLAQDSTVKKILDKYPAYNPIVRPEGVNDYGFYSFKETPKTHDLINAGWGYVLINPSTIQPDNGDGLTCKGIIPLVNQGKARQPNQWGALRAWSWGAARALDYLETDQDVDAKRVGIEGVSRYGKAALVTLAFEKRFAFGLIGSSGKGGTTLHRRNFGESVENLAGYSYYWMAGNYMKYAAKGGMTAADLPVDSHMLIAMCAPRPVFISYGIPEQGDAHWLDHRGSYMAAVAASPVYDLLEVTGLEVSTPYMEAKLPDVEEELLEGKLAWRQHTGGHTDAPNMKHFISWMEAIFEESPSSK